MLDGQGILSLSFSSLSQILFELFFIDGGCAQDVHIAQSILEQVLFFFFFLFSFFVNFIND